VKIAVVEPGESAVLLGGQRATHNIEGVGIGYTPPLFDRSLVDEIIAEQLGPGATVVTLMPDSGLKYLGTDVYRRP